MKGLFGRAFTFFLRTESDHSNTFLYQNDKTARGRHNAPSHSTLGINDHLQPLFLPALSKGHEKIHARRDLRQHYPNPIQKICQP